jgi:hypothetical protein
MIQKPGDGGSVAQVGLQFAVRVAEESPLARQPPHAARGVGIECQVPVPQIPVLGGRDVKKAQAIAPGREESHVGRIDDDLEEERLAGGGPGSKVLEGRPYDLVSKVFRGNVHNPLPRREVKSVRYCRSLLMVSSGPVILGGLSRLRKSYRLFRLAILYHMKKIKPMKIECCRCYFTKYLERRRN